MSVTAASPNSSSIATAAALSAVAAVASLMRGAGTTPTTTQGAIV